MVQTEIQRRKQIGKKYSVSTQFASKLICEDCGGFFGKKVWHSTSKYAREIYQCNNKFAKNKKKCETPHFTEDEIKSMFIKAYNLAMQDKERLLTDTREVIELLANTDVLDEKITSIKNEIDIISEVVRKLVKHNSTEVQSQEEYQKKYNDLLERYNKLKDELDKLINDRAYKLGQSTKLEAFLKEMETAETPIDIWNEELWMIMVESAMVHKDKSITFKFYNGKEIRFIIKKPSKIKCVNLM